MNILSAALALILLVVITFYFVFGMFGKFISDDNKDNGASIAGIKCEVNASDDVANPTKYKYQEVSGIAFANSERAYAVAVDIIISATGSEVAYEYSLNLALRGTKALSNTFFACPIGTSHDLSETGTAFSVGCAYVKHPGDADYTEYSEGVLPTLNGALYPGETKKYSVIVFSVVEANQFPEDYIVGYDLVASQIREVG